MNDVNQRQKYQKQKWHGTTKLAICYWKISKKKFQFTRFSSYEFDSFIRGYHVYQHIWTPVEGETYSCTREPGNEQDCNAVAVMYEDRVVGHIPLAISKCISLFLTLPGSFLETKVIGKRINQGGGYGLEVPCKYRPHFYKNTRLLQINV